MSEDIRRFPRRFPKISEVDFPVPKLLSTTSSPMTFSTKIGDFVNVRSSFSRIGSSLFKYCIYFFQNEPAKAVMAQTFPLRVRNGNAGASRREIAVFDPQA